MLELLVLNVVAMVVLALLPRREAVRPETGRRSAKALLRETRAGHRTLGETILGGARAAGRRIADGIDPAGIGLRSGWKLALAGGALAGLGLLLGSGWAAGVGSPAGSAAVACDGALTGAGGHLARAGADAGSAPAGLHRLPDIRVHIRTTTAAPAVSHAAIAVGAPDVEALRERIERLVERARARAVSEAMGPELEAALAELAAEAAELGSLGGPVAREALTARLRLLEL